MRPQTVAAVCALVPVALVAACASGDLATSPGGVVGDDASTGDAPADRTTHEGAPAGDTGAVDEALTSDSTPGTTGDGSPADVGAAADASDATSCTPGLSCTPSVQCKAGAIDCSSGMPVCAPAADLPNGMSCGPNEVCGSGTCNACTQSAACTPTNQCHTGTIDCSSGMAVCTDTGTSLSDGTACGASSVCESGTCNACGATGQYCCAGGACGGAPNDCIGAVASTCRTNVSPQCTCGTLQQGMELTAGQSLWSCDGHYQLAMQTDGNFVLYEGGTPLWSSNTAGTGSTNFAIMQDDANLVVYTSASVAVWSSGTGGRGCGYYLAVQTDGNVVIYTTGGTAIWDTGT